MNAGWWLIYGLAAIGGALVALAQINLRKSKKLLVDAAKIRAAAQEEFERWRRASEAIKRERTDLRFGGARGVDLDPFKRPPGCLCREVVGGALKIEDFCPAHHPRRPP